jgi:hypothetical protein
MSIASFAASLQPPLAPRNGRSLRVLAICRISTVSQDEKSLADQEALYRRWLDQHANCAYEVNVLASQGSGERLESTEYLRALELVEFGEYDLVLTEDLGRICRRVHAHIFCELCEDHEVRLIALNDHVDTGREDWRLSSFFAVMRHETYNRDTSQRIRRTLRNRFAQGGVFQCEIYGYVKPPGAKSEEDVYKDPSAEAMYEQWFTMLEGGASFAEVADYLNANHVPVGPHTRQERWDCRMVSRITRNPILKGLRVRNDRMSKRINKTGRRKSVKAPPEERLERFCPHLAFIQPARYDRILRTINERNGIYRRKGEDGRDNRRNVPKKRTRWPGQHIFCGICGRMYVYGGHGQKEHLMCNGARAHHCWNGVSVDGPAAAAKLSQAIYSAIESLPGFDSTLLEIVRQEARQRNDADQEQLRQLAREEVRNARELANMLQFIRGGRATCSVREEVERLESEKTELVRLREELERLPRSTLELPSVDEIKCLARDELLRYTMDSPEYGRFMQQLIPRILVFPYRLCDGGKMVLRARFPLTLAGLAPNAARLDAAAEALTQVLQVDLFDPPQREAFRRRVVELRAAKQKEWEIASELGITQTAVQRAASLERRMAQLNTADAYVAVVEPPEDCTKLRRHKHPRYCFQPLDDAGQF